MTPAAFWNIKISVRDFFLKFVFISDVIFDQWCGSGSVPRMISIGYYDLINVDLEKPLKPTRMGICSYMLKNIFDDIDRVKYFVKLV